MLYYFDVKPVRKEQSYLNFLTFVVNEYWNENRTDKKELSKTFTSKVLFDLVENDTALDFITRGWFKYGAIINCIPQEVSVEDRTRFSDLAEKVFKLCEEYDCNKNLYDWQFKQYEKFDNKLYTSMLNLKISLEDNDPAEKNIRAALSNFYSNLFDLEEYDDVNELIESYISISERVLLSSDNVELDSKKICEFFTSVWNCFANFNYAKTVKGSKRKEIQNKALVAYHSELANCKKEISDYLDEAINPSKELVLKISTPLQKELVSEIQKFK